MGLPCNPSGLLGEDISSRPAGDTLLSMFPGGGLCNSSKEDAQMANRLKFALIAAVLSMVTGLAGANAMTDDKVLSDLARSGGIVTTHGILGGK